MYKKYERKKTEQKKRSSCLKMQPRSTMGIFTMMGMSMTGIIDIINKSYSLEISKFKYSIFIGCYEHSGIRVLSLQIKNSSFFRNPKV